MIRRVDKAARERSTILEENQLIESLPLDVFPHTSKHFCFLASFGILTQAFHTGRAENEGQQELQQEAEEAQEMRSRSSEAREF